LFCFVIFKKDYKPNAFPAFLLFRGFAVPPPRRPVDIAGAGGGGARVYGTKNTINPMLFCLFCFVMFKKDYKPNAFPAFLLFRGFAVPPPRRPVDIAGAGGRGGRRGNPQKSRKAGKALGL